MKSKFSKEELLELFATYPNLNKIQLALGVNPRTIRKYLRRRVFPGGVGL